MRYEIEYLTSLGATAKIVIENDVPKPKFQVKGEFEQYRRVIEGGSVKVLSIKAV